MSKANNYHKTVIQLAKGKNIKVYTEIDDILNELDEMEANPLHSEDAVKPKKKRKIRIKVNSYIDTMKKFFDEA